MTKLGSPRVDPLEKAAVLGMHIAGGGHVSDDELESRAKLFHKYVARVRSTGGEDIDVRDAIVGSHALDRERLMKMLATDARRTEWWDPQTLLFDESKACGGLWLIASLFNHSCRGNVSITYRHGGNAADDGSPSV